MIKFTNIINIIKLNNINGVKKINAKNSHKNTWDNRLLKFCNSYKHSTVPKNKKGRKLKSVIDSSGCLPLYGDLEWPRQARSDRYWFTDRGGHRTALGFRGVRIFGIGRDFELDVIVLVEFGQGTTFRSFQCIEQLLNFRWYFPTPGSPGVVLILDDMVTIDTVGARSPGRLLCGRCVACVCHVRGLDVTVRMGRVFCDVGNVRTRRSPSRWSRRRRRVPRRTGAAGIRQSCA